MDLTFDADLDIGEYIPTDDGKPHLLAVRLHSTKVPIKMEFVTNDAAILEGWIELFTEQIAKMKACHANTEFYGKSDIIKGREAIEAALAADNVGADAPNDPVLATEQGEGD